MKHYHNRHSEDEPRKKYRKAPSSSHPNHILSRAKPKPRERSIALAQNKAEANVVSLREVELPTRHATSVLMASSVKALRRRPLIERRLISILRGASGKKEATGVAADKKPLLLPFARLSRLATKLGLQIQPSGTLYVSDDELQLLSWMAKAQRVVRYDYIYHEDIQLTRTIFLCADSATALGWWLPPMTMLAGRDERSTRPA